MLGKNLIQAAAGNATASSTKLNVSPAVNGKTLWDLDVDGDLELSSPTTYTLSSEEGTVTAAVKMWGAGGGEGWNESGYVSRHGGGGGYSSGVIAFSGSYQAVVGAGGRGAPARNTVSTPSTSYLGGASGGRRESDSLWGGSGGGLSGIFASSVAFSNAVMIAGGGGGGGASYGATGRGGGAGGGTTGDLGNYPYAVLINGEAVNLNPLDATNQVSTSITGSVSRNTSIVRYETASVFIGGSNSSTDRITLGPTNSTLNIGTNDFTISCWVYTANTAESYYQRVWWFETDNSGPLTGLALERAIATEAKFTLNTPFGQIASTNPPAKNTFVHLAVARRDNTTYFFVNGVLQGTRNGLYSVTLGTSPVVGNGYYNNALVGGYNGYIDDFFVLNGAALYTSNFTPYSHPAVLGVNKSGGGGTQSAGGAAGDSTGADTAAPLGGDQLTGGRGGSAGGGPTGGGGGGGGYYGGGGGGVNGGDTGGGGGGGSGYLHPTLVSSGTTLKGVANTPGGAKKPGRGTAGFGGHGGVSGGAADQGDNGEPGKIIISANLSNL